MKTLPLLASTFVIFLACDDGPTTGDEPEKPPAYQGEWGSWGSGDGEFEVPADVGIGPDGIVYVADSCNYRIQYFTPSGSYLGKWGAKGEGQREFENKVKMLAVGPTGNVYVPDADNILYFSSNGRFLGEWPTPERTPLGIDVARDGTVYVAEYDREHLRAGIRRFTASGSFLSLNTGNHHSSEGPFEFLDDVAVIPSGDILTLENASRVRRWASDGTQKNIWSAGDHRGVSIALGRQGLIYLPGYFRISTFAPGGDFLYEWGKEGSGPGEFNGVLNLIVADNGTIYTADMHNSRIQYFR